VRMPQDIERDESGLVTKGGETWLTTPFRHSIYGLRDSGKPRIGPLASGLVCLDGIDAERLRLHIREIPRQEMW
jgi:hypothetical protein